MSIIIKPDVPESPKRKIDQKGFSLPEVLVSLCILLLLLQMVWQWGQLMICSETRVQQNQQAILVAKTVLAGLQPDLPNKWSYSVIQKPGFSLLEKSVTVTYGDQHWNFYYAGEQLELDDAE